MHTAGVTSFVTVLAMTLAGVGVVVLEAFIDPRPNESKAVACSR